MASIDSKILKYTSDFVRYVDDIRIFFEKRADAVYALHELTQYLYSYHRLVFSGEKTKVRPVKVFREKYIRDEQKEEKSALIAKADELASEKIEELLEHLPPYSGDFDYDEEYEKVLAEIMDKEHFELLSATYYELFSKAITTPIDFALLRHILRQSSRYRIRNLIPLVLDNFFRMLPVIRESVIYLNAVLNEKTVATYKDKFVSILSSYYLRLPFINLWIFHLLQNPSFSKINLPVNYDVILSTRGKALIALRRQDTTWVRDFRDSIDVLGPRDKRAVLYSSMLLPSDEMKIWVNTVAASGDIIDKSVSSFLISKKKSHK